VDVIRAGVGGIAGMRAGLDAGWGLFTTVTLFVMNFKTGVL